MTHAYDNSTATNFWQGQRVRLRAVEPEDWAHFFTWNADTTYDRYTDEIVFPQSRAALQKWTSELAAGEAANDEFRWVIENVEGNFVGTINTHGCSPRNGTFQYGVAVRREQWRKGYASEAVNIILAYFFGELRYRKAHVHVYAFNHASLRLHRKLGFRQEGRLRRMGYSDGEFFDWVLLGLTAEEHSGRG